jgi:hypothetical protein
MNAHHISLDLPASSFEIAPSNLDAPLEMYRYTAFFPTSSSSAPTHILIHSQLQAIRLILYNSSSSQQYLLSLSAPPPSLCYLILLTLYILCSSSNLAIIHCPPLLSSFPSSPFGLGFLLGPGDLPLKAEVVSRGVPRLEGVVTSYGLFVLVFLFGDGFELIVDILGQGVAGDRQTRCLAYRSAFGRRQYSQIFQRDTHTHTQDRL